MNLFNIIEEIEKVDPDFQDRISPRRDAIKNITSFGSKVAVAALPFALGSIFKKAYAADTTSLSVAGILNYALTLEYLEAYLYNQATAAAGLIPASDASYIATITTDENNHVTFLQGIITKMGQTPITTPQIDLTGGDGTGNGPFVNVLSNYQTFLLLAETLEDTGVRAYKGTAPALVGNQTVLTAALSIHAVEARHASAIRYLRTLNYGASVLPWITSSTGHGNDTGFTGVDPNYLGEDNTMQGIIDVTTLPSLNGSTTSVATATAAFDEPLTMDQVSALIKGTFIVEVLAP